MISEILTGLFAGATVGYLWAKQRHENSTSTDSVQPIGGTDRITISKEASDRMKEQNAANLQTSEQQQSDHCPAR